ncbi:hypothetical protein KIPB_008607 [Kipferlia bialata]|uniref:Uncharacterized protein n=1 Tax=Kipferlia bialata TaxID=797122 RepID=A0A9K3D252_9EUKA|nr:hypothetical protein KIPB_008607 [Kipferlia bialata]|eukprot:g8607.t1
MGESVRGTERESEREGGEVSTTEREREREYGHSRQLSAISARETDDMAREREKEGEMAVLRQMAAESRGVRDDDPPAQDDKGEREGERDFVHAAELETLRRAVPALEEALRNSQAALRERPLRGISPHGTDGTTFDDGKEREEERDKLKEEKAQLEARVASLLVELRESKLENESLSAALTNSHHQLFNAVQAQENCVDMAVARSLMVSLVEHTLVGRGRRPNRAALEVLEVAARVLRFTDTEKRRVALLAGTSIGDTQGLSVGDLWMDFLL